MPSKKVTTIIVFLLILHFFIVCTSKPLASNLVQMILHIYNASNAGTYQENFSTLLPVDGGYL